MSLRENTNVVLAHFSLDENGAFTSSCRSFESAFGSTYGKNISDFLVSDDKKKFPKEIPAPKKSKARKTYRLVTAEGMIVTCTHDHFANGNRNPSETVHTYKFVCFLSQGDTQSEIPLFNDIGFPVVSCDNSGTFRGFNVPFGRLLNTGDDGLEDENFFNCLTGLDEDDLKAAMIKSLSETGQWSGGVQLKTIVSSSKTFFAKAKRVQHNVVDEGHIVFSLVESNIDPNEEGRITVSYEGYDYLTNLPTRPFFFEALNKAISRQRRTKSKDALLLIDLDHFKDINDTYGHNVGDEVLKVSANRLKQVIRDSDIVARLGGDEFGFILYDFGTLESLGRIAEKIRISMNKPIHYREHTIETSASIGIVSDLTGDNVDMVMEQADLSSYFAKHKGRNIYQFFNKELSDQYTKRKTIRKRLAQAILQNKLSLEFQPRIDIARKNITAVESFLRWKDDLLGQVPPLDFIHIAEEDGMAGSLNKWVLEKAVAQFAQWAPHLDISTNLSINVSLRQLLTADFVSTVEKSLTEHNMPFSALSLEISEETLMTGGERITNSLKRLKKLGTHIILDNYGTSYSSPSLINDMCVDTVKIDRSIISQLEDKTTRRQLDAMFSFCQKMELGMIADGVENKKDFEYLRDMGCVQFQGYYFTSPISSEDSMESFRKILSDQLKTHGLDFPIL